MNKRTWILAGVGAVIVAVVAIVLVRREPAAGYYTGFVEGEERVIRSEIAGRVLEVRFGEGDPVPANEVIARLDDADAQAKLASKRQQVAVLDAQIRGQEERVSLTGATWSRDVGAREAELAEAKSAAGIAERSWVREQGLQSSGASTVQLLDDARARRDQARAALARTREMAARTEAEKSTIALAEHGLLELRARRELALAELAELEVAAAKTDVRAPAADTVVETQFLWPGELAQPGTAIVSVLDPSDKYVQIYVPVEDLPLLGIGTRVDIELDSRPGERVPGEVSFIAGEANFTPEKIETRGDRMTQVYRAKVRILEGVERFKPGTEGNVYLARDDS